MPHPICYPTTGGTFDPDTLLRKGEYLIAVPITAGTPLTFTHGLTLDNVRLLAFDSDGLSIPDVNVVVDPANPQTKGIITSTINHLANEVTIVVFGILPAATPLTDLAITNVVHIVGAMTAGTAYTVANGITASNTRFLPFTSTGLSIPALNVVADPAQPTTHFIVTPAVNYLAGEVYVLVIGNP